MTWFIIMAPLTILGIGIAVTPLLWHRRNGARP